MASGYFSSTLSLLVLWNKLAFPQSCTMVTESKKWKKGRKEERDRANQLCTSGNPLLLDPLQLARCCFSQARL